MIHPQPKPTPETRSRTMVDTRGFRFEKIDPAKDRDYRRWVARHACAVKSHDHPISRKALTCLGQVDPAHIAKIGAGIKASDYAVIPLCRRHHDEQEPSWPRFEERYSFNRYEVAFLFLEEWHLRTGGA